MVRPHGEGFEPGKEITDLTKEAPAGASVFMRRPGASMRRSVLADGPLMDIK